MPTHKFDALVRVVLESSEADSWNLAVDEWDVIALEEDPENDGTCVCTQEGLHKLFTLRNALNGSYLHPVGSRCVQHFGRHDLDIEVAQLTALYALRSALINGDEVTLESGHFTRALLEYLRAAGVFPPNRWNNHNGDNDYEFLRQMFNKRNKYEITAGQRRKINTLLATAVFPFVRNYERLN